MVKKHTNKYTITLWYEPKGKEQEAMEDGNFEALI